MANEFKLLINAENLKKMLVLQENLNVKYNGENWRDKVKMSSVKLAILDEVSELLREIESEWKWWKHNPSYNRQKAVYELIDLIHFGLLAVLHRYDLGGLIKRIENDMDDVVYPDQFGPFNHIESSQEFFVDAMTQFVVGVNAQGFSYNEVLIQFCNMVQAGGELIGIDDPADIYHAYVLKNHRNHIRVDGGVMVGLYDKSKESDLPIAK